MKRRHIIFLIIILITAACSKEEIEYTDNDLIIAAYLPYWGMDKVDLNSLSHLDILYYFSIAPDQDGLFVVPEGLISDINLARDRLRNDALLFLVLGGWYESETIFPMFEDPEKGRTMSASWSASALSMILTVLISTGRTTPIQFLRRIVAY